MTRLCNQTGAITCKPWTHARAHVGQVCWPQHRTVELAPIPRSVSLHLAPQPPRTPQNTQCLHCARNRRMAAWDDSAGHYLQTCSILGTMVDKRRAWCRLQSPVLNAD